MSGLQVYCDVHQEELYQYIDLAKTQQFNRLACAVCYYENSINYAECIPLHKVKNQLIKAMREPQEYLQKLLTPSALQSYHLTKLFAICEKNVERMFKEQEDKFIELDCIVEQIKQLLAEQRNKLKKLQEDLNKDKKELLKVGQIYKQAIQFEEMTECVYNLEALGDAVHSGEYKQYIQQFSDIVTSMQKNNCNQIITLINKMRMKQNVMSQDLKLTDIQPFQQKFEGILNNYKDFIDKTYSEYYPPVKDLPESNIAYKSFLLYLVGIVNEKLNKQISRVTPLYVGSRDGLGSSQFWGKVSGYTNCLMIFKTNKNTVFGGFTPCQWQASNGYCCDYTNASFLFSQFNWAIYPLRPSSNGKAIYRNTSTGPIFGENDICITSNFQSCTSALGRAYEYEQLSQDYKFQLLGAENANITECEVYQLS